MNRLIAAAALLSMMPVSPVVAADAEQMIEEMEIDGTLDANAINDMVFATMAEVDELSEADRAQLEQEMELAAGEMERVRQELDRARGEMDSARASHQEALREAQAEMEKAARKMARIGQEIAGEIAIEMKDFRRRAMIGLSLGEDTKQGIEVIAVTPDGPADEAGVMAGDVLVSIDGKSLSEADGSPTMFLLEHMSDIEPGQQVSVGLVREGQQRDVLVKAAENEFATFKFVFPDPEDFDPENYRFVIPQVPAAPPAPDAPVAPDAPNAPFPGRGAPLYFGHGYSFGGHPVIAGLGQMELVTLTPGLGSYFGTETGLLVVRAPSNAALQLRDGDVILRIGDRVPESPGQALRILASYEDGDRVEIEIMREKRPVRLDVVFPQLPADAFRRKNFEPVIRSAIRPQSRIRT